ncbi:MAG: FecR family protein [Adhaeribacter sp.]
MPKNQSKEYYQELARKWKAGTITEAEKLEFDHWFNSFDDTQLSCEADETPGQLQERLYQAISEKVNLPRTIRKDRESAWRQGLAASLLLAILACSYFFLAEKTPPAPLAVQTQTQALPGPNKATLTLADGSVINLTDARGGTLAREGQTSIHKTGRGELVYQAPEADPSDKRLNTISTPRGGTFKIVLPDGSRVWLHAASSLTFPASFTGKERRVQMTGEAYFEVAKDPAKPFKVQAPNSLVEVLGTRFNIMAYPEEPEQKTTLVEGAVQFSSQAGSAVLKPGEQVVWKDKQKLRVLQVNTDQVLGWKNGYFIFKNEPLGSIMRQIERWYDAEVVIHGDASGLEFVGEVSKSKNLASVLHIMELTGNVQFQVEPAERSAETGKIKIHALIKN